MTSPTNETTKIQNPFDPATNFVPYANEYSNFEIARKLFTDNLEHHPLPDKLDDQAYHKLQLAREPNAGLALDPAQSVTGVAYSDSGAKGPTHCTKLKVHRSVPVGAKMEPREPRYIIRKNYVTPIELALGWDIVPFNSRDEPKPPTHIDGSNGSKAPSVFMLVHSTLPDSYKTEDNYAIRVSSDEPPADRPDNLKPNTGALFSVNPDITRNFTAPNFNETRAVDCRCYKNRFLRACKFKRNHSPRAKSEYKTSFKSAPKVKYPKLPEPYLKRSYQIDTLAPPFSLRANTRILEYPERNRMMTTYQVSYNRFRKRRVSCGQEK